MCLHVNEHAHVDRHSFQRFAVNQAKSAGLANNLHTRI